ncbi:MAG TPA: hypothetical protein VGQ00_03680 [Candidatus Norongarragalinales archaeon]|jgi:hypothetical protein|nr:hypothetical protein [Candidatus Norongarragalinales archaeon]
MAKPKLSAPSGEHAFKMAKSVMDLRGAKEKEVSKAAEGVLMNMHRAGVEAAARRLRTATSAKAKEALFTLLESNPHPAALAHLEIALKSEKDSSARKRIEALVKAIKK